MALAMVCFLAVDYTCQSAVLFVEDVVGVVGCDEAIDWQSHLMTEESGCDVTEVTARYTDDQLVSQALLLHAGVCIEIVECLEARAGYIDRVGRSQASCACSTPRP